MSGKRVVEEERERRRFDAKADKSGGEDACWIWKSGTARGGYGITRWRGSQIMAHRVALILTGVSVPRDMMVCHRCDNPPCVNPKHLFVGSRSQNMADMVGKDRQARGERNGQAKLTPTQVQELRLARREGAKIAVLSQRFGVSESLVTLIASKKRWRHLPLPDETTVEGEVS